MMEPLSFHPLEELQGKRLWAVDALEQVESRGRAGRVCRRLRGQWPGCERARSRNTNCHRITHATIIIDSPASRKVSLKSTVCRVPSMLGYWAAPAPGKPQRDLKEAYVMVM